MTSYSTAIKEYISKYPASTCKLLRQMRATIQKAAPKAEELISYGMPAFKYKGMLVWYAAYSKHIGFYPKPSALLAFKKELSGYKSSKGAVQFPLDKPLPVMLIKKMVQFRLKENLAKIKLKSK